MQVGAIRIDPVWDGHGVVDALGFFQDVRPEVWQTHRDEFDAQGRWDFPVGGYLLRSADRVALVDVGLGPRVRLFMSGGSFLTSLRALGVEPADVTDVLITHLHSDHYGWAWSYGEITFPNATYRCHRADWDHYVLGRGRPSLAIEAESLPGAASEDVTWMDVLLGIEDRLEPWDSDASLWPGLDVVMATGHTPGSTVVVASSQSRRAFMVGDAVHCPAQLTDYAWRAQGDVHPEQAIEVRARLAAQLAGSQDVISGPHFPDMAFGQLAAVPHGHRWTRI